MSFKSVDAFKTSNNGSSILDVTTVAFPFEVFCQTRCERLILHGRGSLQNLKTQASIRPSNAIESVLPVWANCEKLTSEQVARCYLNSPCRFRNYTYDLSKPTYFLGLEKCVVEIKAFDIDTHLCKVILNGDPFAKYVLGLFLLEPNFKTNDWADMLWNEHGVSKKVYPDTVTPSICPECQGTHKVQLFQFWYNCSKCSDGKRI